MNTTFVARTPVTLATLAFLFLAAPLPAAAQPLSVDPVHSTVLFRIKHLNTSYAWGRFNAFSGTLNLDGPNPALEVQIKADSIDTGNAQREQHLKSPDFFNVKQFPSISFKSTRVARTGEGKYTVDGTLSLHGVEQPVSVQLTQTGAGKNQKGAPIAGYETSFKINRSDYGMKFLLEGLSDEVLLIVSLECGAR